jgi:hypothetical protein
MGFSVVTPQTAQNIVGIYPVRQWEMSLHVSYPTGNL